MKTYKDAGVDIDLAEKLVQKIKQLARKTFNERVLADIGLFGAFYDVKFEEYKHPVLVSSVDGVGTKLKIAFLVNKHDTIGQDLVNHCVNDILVCGAKPLFFLDYFATGKLNIDVAEQVIYGLAKACEENNCTLIGGETAEMPGFYQEGEYDLAGTIVGIVEKEKIIKGDKVKDGDILIALPSTGLHTNGYSLARMILLEKFKIDEFIPELNTTLAEELLKIHRSYLKPILKLLDKFEIHAMAHITGGGIIGNTKRVVPETLKIKIYWDSWERPAIFNLIQKLGNVPEEDMRRTFNLGIGLILIVDKNDADKIINELKLLNENPFIIGEITK
ncbi:phosphoribosylformylglycinamidine cyclo-ligase [Candidatus Kryptonium thompsonii]|uniref:Phosphoribosylformylglycinamidine cyclo-ligase n=1 Tax=Candidatus Kryptonium thompsonii TaxID=1633631 RepID=A0A0N7MZL8_9BACT|nr:phosphoribosylformylglycinamidine cyclo-ligase [Candidatus Kryptonium thompsoni]CUS78419.1 phosphoribosylformylglycinamidine cyclo-ligase [Candidatus Kryptonium thompsoni]CUS83986.1 phosphoribosylformylglycinamidine cyclo-ligase [Candidatus Kryptonium thompsoni]CUS90941.1 phosphoribosylformylglycinamidine cyclo-ligase [Candidatus Kryptonium thompsoni]CUS91009.1 phosphoribosylformylglycinamidine cyclo-ligase [Candidatus Kryptonium thompsoni]CUS91368.1 phosphoribosylformylglycinamidine cyclo-